MNTRPSGAQRRAGGRDPSDPAESVDLRRRWRTTLAGVVVATLALGGMTALAATPAVADEAVVAEQSDPAVAEPAAEPPADPLAEEPAPPAEEPAQPPAEESAPPAEQSETPAEESATEPPTDEPTETVAVTEPLAQESSEESSEEPVAVALLVPPDPAEVVDKVEICHRTASYSNPYVVNEPSIDAILGSNNTQNAHYEEHQGPIFYAEIPKHTEWGDIIPPFSYEDSEGQIQSFPGYNWDATGQAIYDNDCVLPEPPPTPTMELKYDTCVGYEPPFLSVFLSGLLANLDYRVTVSNQDGVVDVWEIPAGTTGDVSNTWLDIPGGDYTVLFEQSIIADVWETVDTQSFSVEACPELAVEAVATGCSLGDDGTALVSLSGLIVGEEYDWQLNGDDYAIADTLIAPSETLDVPFGDLPPGNYEFEIRYYFLESYISATATFFVEPCAPDITVVVTECPAYGGDGSAVVKLSNLVEGLTYEVWVVDQHQNGVVYGDVKSVVGDATHVAEVDMSPLPAGKDFTAWVYAPWMPPGGSSEWGEVDWFEVSASADFSLQPCPAPPVKPVTPAGLAETGTSDPMGPILAALLLLGLGGAALAARPRREGRMQRSE